MTVLPVDLDKNIIPAMRFKVSGGAHSIAATATSARNTTAFDANTRVVSLYATGPVYIRFGGSSITAANTDHYFPSGTYYDVAIGGGKTGQTNYIAVLRADTDCTVYVSEKE